MTVWGQVAPLRMACNNFFVPQIHNWLKDCELAPQLLRFFKNFQANYHSLRQLCSLSVCEMEYVCFILRIPHVADLTDWLA